MSELSAPIFPESAKNWLRFAAMTGLGGFAIGVFVNPVRAWSGWLIASYFFLAAALGAVVLLSFLYLANAGWTSTIKRVLEGVGGYLPVGAVTMLMVLPGVHSIYEWSHHDVVDKDPLLKAKSVYLNLPFFALRMAVALGLWIFFATLMRRISRQQDHDKDVKHTRKLVALAAGFVCIFGLSYSMGAFDWLMSTSPHFPSTIFAYYQFAGVLVTGVSITILTVIYLRRRGLLPNVSTAHLHDLGKLAFAFSTLWAYLWFSQFMLIWYANLPEETAWYLQRWDGGWSFLFFLNFVVNWVIPFFTLLPKPQKKNEWSLIFVCILLLSGRFLDLYMIVVPANVSSHSMFSVWDFLPILGLGGVFALVVERQLRGASLIPRGDPYLMEGMSHH